MESTLRNLINERLSAFNQSDFRGCFCIYALCEPERNVMRYIGRTKNLFNRYRDHVLGKTSQPVSQWIDTLRKQSTLPRLMVLSRIYTMREHLAEMGGGDESSHLVRTCKVIWPGVISTLAEAALIDHIVNGRTFNNGPWKADLLNVRHNNKYLYVGPHSAVA